MGLDAVNLIIGLEETFGVPIPDAAAQEMRTPRDIVDFLASRLPTTCEDCCLTQQFFYRLRRGFQLTVSDCPPLGPRTPLKTLVSFWNQEHVWRMIRARVGERTWPVIPLRWLFGDGLTLGDLAKLTAAHLPPPARGEPWSRQRIELTVRRVVWDTVGIDRFSLDDELVADMGIH